MEDYNFYRDNVAYLFRHFDDFMTKAKYFMTPLPFEVKYELFVSKHKTPIQTFRLVKGPITLGTLFSAWKDYPELFRITKEGKTGMIFSFNGSPHSGLNNWSAVDTESGEVFSGTGAPSFLDRCQCLNDIVLQCEECVEEFKQRNGLDTFTGATLQETVDYIKSLEK